MNPKEFEEQIVKLESGELDDAQVEALRELASRDENADAFLARIEAVLSQIRDAFNQTPDPGDAFTGKVMAAIRNDAALGKFRMQETPASARMKRTGRFIYLLIGITLILAGILITLSLRTLFSPPTTLPPVFDNPIGAIIPWRDGVEIDLSTPSAASAPIELYAARNLLKNDAVFTRTGQAEVFLYSNLTRQNPTVATLDAGTEVVFSNADSLRFNAGRLVLFRPDDATGSSGAFTVKTQRGILTLFPDSTVALSLDIDDRNTDSLTILVLNGESLMTPVLGKSHRLIKGDGIRVSMGHVTRLHDFDKITFMKWYDTLRQIQKNKSTTAREHSP